MINMFIDTIDIKFELSTINENCAENDRESEREERLEQTSVKISIPIDTGIDLSFQQNAIKSLKNYVGHLDSEGNDPLSPGELDIVDEIFDQNEKTWKTMVVITHILKEIVI